MGGHPSTSRGGRLLQAGDSSGTAVLCPPGPVHPPVYLETLFAIVASVLLASDSPEGTPPTHTPAEPGRGQLWGLLEPRV